jgi:lipopolysaccharide biosynthesis glycosyltransferase
MWTVPWFMCLNNNSDHYKRMALAALASSSGYRGVDRYIIYTGEDPEFMDAARQLDCEVIVHRTCLADAMAVHLSEDFRNIALGAYLRVDIPVVLKRLDRHYPYYLYTDCDVMMQRDPFPALCALRPATFAASSEFAQERVSYFNSGVMWCNTTHMLATHEGLCDFAVEKRFDLVAHDQGALNGYYGERYDFLNTWFNWKPYWGVNDQAHVIHFHGPKPYHILSHLAGGPLHEAYRGLYHGGTHAAYMVYVDRWQVVAAIGDSLRTEALSGGG